MTKEKILLKEKETYKRIADIIREKWEWNLLLRNQK